MGVATPLLVECEDDTHTPEMGTWESSRTPKTSEFNCRGQNTSFWGVLHVIGKLLKFTCRKWPCMSHLDICSTSYGKKKGQESKLVVWLLTTKSRESTRPWCVQMDCDTPLESSPIRGLSKELWTNKVLGVQPKQFRDSSLGVSGQKAIQMWVSWSNAENTIWGKVVASPKFGPWWVLWVQSCPWFVLAPSVLQNAN